MRSQHGGKPSIPVEVMVNNKSNWPQQLQQRLIGDQRGQPAWTKSFCDSPRSRADGCDDGLFVNEDLSACLHRRPYIVLADEFGGWSSAGELGEGCTVRPVIFAYRQEPR